MTFLRRFDRFVLWEDIFDPDLGVLHFGDGKLDRFLSGAWTRHPDLLHSIWRRSGRPCRLSTLTSGPLKTGLRRDRNSISFRSCRPANRRNSPTVRGARIRRKPGAQGDRPAEPELLDYLASEFVKNGWSIRKLQRPIMPSADYQLGAAPNEKAMAVDCDIRLLWRFSRHRLDAEALRDDLLFVAGKLDVKEGGMAQEPSRLWDFPAPG